MINLRNSPFLWLALLLLMAYGLLDLSELTATNSRALLLLLIFFICALGTMLKYTPGKGIVSTLLLSTCVLTAGSIRQMAFKRDLFPVQTLHQGEKIEAVVKVIKVLKAKQNASTLHCEMLSARSVHKKTQVLFADKYLLVRIKGTEQKKSFPADSLTINGWLFPIQGPQNPHAFDLRQYYKTLGIRHQVTCADSNVTYHPSKQFGLMNISARWQGTLCGVIQKHTSPDVAQMTNALVFGERSAMNEEIRDAFANSGAMHVLSVSGMHMAIIYSMLYLILGAPGGGSLTRRILRLSLYTISIIIYVGLTGASPAVLRAGLMIFLFILGKAMGWNTPIWNLLGFAAFMMLWDNPFIWKHIGFQLSFLAMAGILLYAKPIIRYFSFRHILLHRIWEITAVSIAAQVFILPIILHQFFQLPLTFVMSSLVAMPASYLIIFGALLNIILSPLQFDWLWRGYDHVGQFFLMIMKWLAKLNPNMNFSMPQLTELMLIVAILTFSVGLLYHWSNGKRLALLLSLGALLSLGWHRAIQWTTNDLTIYHNYSGLVMDMIVNGQCISIQDSSVMDRQVEFTTRGNRVFRDVIHVEQLRNDMAYSRANWYFSNSGFYSSALSCNFWSGNTKSFASTAQSSYVLINDCADLGAIKNHLKANKSCYTILPAHLERTAKKDLVKFLEENEIKYWDIATQGYFKIEL